MKILKLKSILFSLMAIALVTVFLSSCEKDKIVTESKTETNREIASAFILPKGYDKDLSEKEINEFLDVLNEAEMGELIESNRIASYLIGIEKFEMIQSELQYGEKFTDVVLP